jgi:hypothetical protein
MKRPIWLQTAGHHPQQIGGGLANVAAEELERTLHAAPFHDRHREGRMEADTLGGGGTREVVVACDVRYPGGRPTLPDTSRQADTSLECGRRGGRRKLLERQSRGMPGAGAPHALLRPIDLPDGAALPAECVANASIMPRRRLSSDGDSVKARAVSNRIRWLVRSAAASRPGVSFMNPRVDLGHTLRVRHRSQTIAEPQRIER